MDKYEISLWEDILVPSASTAPEHYEERKIGIIGSNTMSNTGRAFEPKLVRNINGSVTFTFKLYYSLKEEEVKEILYEFIDKDNVHINVLKDRSQSDTIQLYYQAIIRSGDYNTNPFVNLICNERKLKVLWEDKWYDLVVKNIEKDSSAKILTYTCKDANINELAKTGFDLEFNTDLGNNMGTIDELGERIVDGTDWVVDKDGSDIIRQETEEAVYELTCGDNITAHNQTKGIDETIPSGAEVLFMYSSKANKGNSVQFLYNADGYVTEEGQELVTNADCYQLDGIIWDGISVKLNDTVIFNVYDELISNRYRGKRLVESQKAIYDPLNSRNVNVYKATQDDTNWLRWREGDEIYGFTNTEYTDATVVNNIIANGKNFQNANGWITDEHNPLFWTLYPKYDTEMGATYEGKSYLKFNSNQPYLNAGIYHCANFLPENGLEYGENYILRFKAMTNNAGSPSGAYYDDDVPEITIISTDGTVSYFTVHEGYAIEDNWCICDLQCTHSLPRPEVFIEKPLITLKFNDTVWLEEIEFFKVEYDSSDHVIYPGAMDSKGMIKHTDLYYNHTRALNDGITRKEDIQFFQLVDTDSEKIEPVSNNFEKVRSISEKNSNRFNLLQKLAETFECWIEFDVPHDSTGKLEYINGKPTKRIRFKQTIGKFTGLAFTYGLDLRSIKRTLVSDQLATKIIVTPNKIEFATDGFCSIARSRLNYPRVGYILNFDYYINNGLLSREQLNNDLYNITDDGIKYYYYLNLYNQEYDSLSVELAKVKDTINKQEAFLKVYEGSLSSTQEQIMNLQQELMALTTTDDYEDALEYVTNNPGRDDLQVKLTAIQNYLMQKVNYEDSIEGLKASLEDLNTQKEDIATQMEELEESIEELDKKFNSKYSYFIQEGTWTDSNYIDDNLYFLDACQVAYTSSRPKVSYDISVVRLSSLDEFKNRKFELGDVAFVQDGEFFGFNYENDIKTPKREKVLLSEVTYNFDSPDKDTFTVQNYKTQYDDLFQRITASTQNLEYNKGDYQKAANIISTDGIIKDYILEESLNTNSNILRSALNESVVSDNTGITITNLNEANLQSRITSGGMFLSTDGGETWRSAIRADGISVDALTAGIIRTNKISIFDGQYNTFKWDADGISAFEIDSAKAPDEKNFTRFDRFGIYGIRGNATFRPTSIGDIKDAASFGILWGNFFLNGNNGAFEITTDDDVDYFMRACKDNKEKFKIDREGNATFGGTITVGSDNPVIIGEHKVGSTTYAIYSKDFKLDNSGYATFSGALSAASGTFAGTITVGSDNPVIIGEHKVDGTTYAIYSTPFKLDNNGNATITGKITATAGEIAGWKVGIPDVYKSAGVPENCRALYNSGTDSKGDEYGTYLWDPKNAANHVITVGKLETLSDPNQKKINPIFSVSKDGSLKATKGTIGGWTISETSLSAGTASNYVGLATVHGTTDDGYRIWAGNANPASAPFSVTKTGSLKATNADIKGKITATSGSFTGEVAATSGIFSNDCFFGSTDAATGWKFEGASLYYYQNNQKLFRFTKSYVQWWDDPEHSTIKYWGNIPS